MTGSDLEPRRCTAHTSAGNPCRKAPILGGTVCGTHGGRAPHVRAAANARVLELRLRGEVQAAGWEPVTDPVGFFQDVAGEVRAFLDLCRSELTHLSKLDYRDGRGTEDVKAAVAVYERALDRAVNTADHMVARGIEAKVASRTHLGAAFLLEVGRGICRRAGVPDFEADAIIEAAVAEATDNGRSNPL